MRSVMASVRVHQVRQRMASKTRSTALGIERITANCVFVSAHNSARRPPLSVLRSVVVMASDLSRPALVTACSLMPSPKASARTLGLPAVHGALSEPSREFQGVDDGSGSSTAAEQGREHPAHDADHGDAPGNPAR